MKLGIPNGWTGGQYSMFRIVLGAFLLVHFAWLVPHAAGANAGVTLPLLVAAALAAVPFLLGWQDRIAAIVMAFVLLFGALPLHPVLLATGCLLLVHAALPSAPFWSLAARGRVDPRGGWQMRPILFSAAWAVTSLGYAWNGWRTFSRLDPAAWLELLYAPLALFRRARPWIWTAMLLVHLGRLVWLGFGDVGILVTVLHVFTFDPGWIPRRSPETVDKLLYDGSCGLCHGTVRLLLAEDASGSAFVFAPLGTGEFDVDSAIVKTADGRVLMRSDAIIQLLRRLGGFWRLAGALFALAPRVLRDAAYDFVASIRYRIFGRTKDACPIMPADLRKRFSV